MPRIVRTDLNFEREPLAAPWGFKGGYLTELWQTVALLQLDSGISEIGLGVQSVLWSDPRVFVNNSESAGNALMLSLTQKALSVAKGMDFKDPLGLQDSLFPTVYEFGKSITGLTDLNPTFVLNALTPIDLAAWRLYHKLNPTETLESLFGSIGISSLAQKQNAITIAPAVGYGLSLDSVAELRNQGFSVFKIKIGSDPDKDGNVEKMLKWDCERISSIHSLIGNMLDSEEAPPLYYLDANSRYPSISSVQRLADHIEQIGALSQTILLEEPLQNFRSEPVHQIPITVVADESATDIQTVNELIDLGYGAVALKPIAKTLSKTLQVAELCNQRGIASFCADLTVNPAMLDWNRTIAARLDSIPGLSSGLMETNGFQNYADWKRLSSFHPQPDAGWTQMVDGKFVLDPGFFDNNGCIFDALPHYESLTHNG